MRIAPRWELGVEERLQNIANISTYGLFVYNISHPEHLPRVGSNTSKYTNNKFKEFPWCMLVYFKEIQHFL